MLINTEKQPLWLSQGRTTGIAPRILDFSPPTEEFVADESTQNICFLETSLLDLGTKTERFLDTREREN